MAVKVEETRTLLVQVGSDQYGGKGGKETYKITIPAASKVTFGPFSPGGKGYGADGSATLRIYEGVDKQRACFRNVINFRDLSFPMERVVREVKKSTNEEDNGKGTSVKVESVNVNEFFEEA